MAGASRRIARNKPDSTDLVVTRQTAQPDHFRAKIVETLSGATKTV
jgi:hypothetical protein